MSGCIVYAKCQAFTRLNDHRGLLRLASLQQLRISRLNGVAELRDEVGVPRHNPEKHISSRLLWCHCRRPVHNVTSVFPRPFHCRVRHVLQRDVVRHGARRGWPQRDWQTGFSDSTELLTIHQRQYSKIKSCGS